MAKTSRSRRTRARSRKHNPTGALLVNPGKRGHKSRHAKRRSGAKRFSLAGLVKRIARKRNPLLANPKHSRKHRRVKVRGHYRHTKRNPLLANPRHRNPAGGIVKSVRGMVGKLPLVGGFVAGMIDVLGGGIGGAIGVLPTSMLLPKVSKWIPDWLKPYAYTVVGAAISTGIKMLPFKLPYQNQLAIGVAAAGGAVDMYRYRHGASQDLGEDDLDSLLSGESDIGDASLGAADFGNDGTALAATEFAGADLADADYVGDGDFSAEEIAAIELGRAHYARKFLRARPAPGPRSRGESSEHAGKPGQRWGWLIYWVGFDTVQRIARLPEQERRQAIEHMRLQARLNARKLLAERADSTSMQEAETAGLLVAA